MAFLTEMPDLFSGTCNQNPNQVAPCVSLEAFLKSPLPWCFPSEVVRQMISRIESGYCGTLLLKKLEVVLRDRASNKLNPSFAVTPPNLAFLPLMSGDENYIGKRPPSRDKVKRYSSRERRSSGRGRRSSSTHRSRDHYDRHDSEGRHRKKAHRGTSSEKRRRPRSKSPNRPKAIANEAFRYPLNVDTFIKSDTSMKCLDFKPYKPQQENKKKRRDHEDSFDNDGLKARTSHQQSSFHRYNKRDHENEYSKFQNNNPKKPKFTSKTSIRSTNNETSLEPPKSEPTPPQIEKMPDSQKSTGAWGAGVVDDGWSRPSNAGAGGWGINATQNDESGWASNKRENDNEETEKPYDEDDDYEEDEHKSNEKRPLLSRNAVNRMIKGARGGRLYKISDGKESTIPTLGENNEMAHDQLPSTVPVLNSHVMPETDEAKQCWFGQNCSDEGCPFLHPANREFRVQVCKRLHKCLRVVERENEGKIAALCMQYMKEYKKPFSEEDVGNLTDFCKLFKKDFQISSNKMFSLKNKPDDTEAPDTTLNPDFLKSILQPLEETITEEEPLIKIESNDANPDNFIYPTSPITYPSPVSVDDSPPNIESPGNIQSPNIIESPGNILSPCNIVSPGMIESPGNVISPSSPNNVTSPSIPLNPVSPAKPLSPEDSVKSFSPTNPASPAKLSDHAGPASTAKAASPTNPTSPAKAPSPRDPASPAKPASPSGLASPTKPASPSDPEEAPSSTNPASPAKPASPSDHTSPAKALTLEDFISSAKAPSLKNPVSPTKASSPGDSTISTKAARSGILISFSDLDSPTDQVNPSPIGLITSMSRSAICKGGYKGKKIDEDLTCTTHGGDFDAPIILLDSDEEVEDEGSMKKEHFNVSRCV